ncbi:hypothetical protein P153DRAFT_390825 [Dothidotthia symphoricarpi CBS 119687]|uniref:BTB domain-containing protein n=1 Tax=Dothidotthia symphoricarpi CBS 119687 TaxID=1392245 RepID=A0A6A5ZZF9_9PLEO|nr:uncharacterized protein P153DRAFT_390825 [Dothidotthia symphoricarpi CBS 119687]KAF2124273.1 hypothetical protein P153DRAFT_390825 [Dothidotthia symphoricarpi CBS 119687]
MSVSSFSVILTEEFLKELFNTKTFSDFTFTDPGDCELSCKVHKVVLSAKSPVFKHLFETHDKEADYLELLRSEDTICIGSKDDTQKTALRRALSEIVLFCYYGGFSYCQRDYTKNFEVSVLPHLFVHDLGFLFQIPGLIEHAEEQFKNNFKEIVHHASKEQVTNAFMKCVSTAFKRDNDFGARTLEFVRRSTMALFNEQIKHYKNCGQLPLAVDLARNLSEARDDLCRQFNHELAGSENSE